MSECVSCGTDVATIGDTPICSMSCRTGWVKSQLNQMDDEDAHCPLCKSEHETVTDAVYHANHQHRGHYNRTETCECCLGEFEPKNSTGPNKFCSEACFGLDQRVEDVTLTCERDDCDEKFTVVRSRAKIQKFCSKSCSTRGEEHWAWQGGSDNIRKTPEYYQWKKKVHQSRDDCVDCGSTEELQAHHITPISDDENLATDVSNGELLCWECHSEKHPNVPENLFRY